MEGPMGLKMSEAEINEYMNALLGGKIKAEGLEAVCVEQFKMLSNEIAQAHQSVQRLKAALEAGVKDIDRMNGRREAFVNLLVAAEEGRRNLQAEKEGKLRLVPNKPGAPEGPAAPPASTGGQDKEGGNG